MRRIWIMVNMSCFFFLTTEIVRKNCDPFNKGRRKEEDKFWKRMETIYKKEGMFNNDSCAWSTIYNPQEENEYNFSKLRISHTNEILVYLPEYSPSCHVCTGNGEITRPEKFSWKCGNLYDLVILMKSL